MVRRTPGSALLPYATLFRSKLYRQGVSGEGELAEGFPKTEEELFAYDGLMLGSVEASFFSVEQLRADRKSTRLNSSHANISYAVFCLKKTLPSIKLRKCSSK